ncbi:hypothetical protein [Lacinutrix sp. MEBiC02595]
MKSYISKIILFLIPLFLLVLLLLVLAKQKHQFRSSSYYYFDEFDSAFYEKDANIVALGNSKLLSAIDKTAFEENNQHKVAVLGYSSANISISKLTLESYLNNCSKLPQLILLEVSWFTFNKERTHLHNIAGDLFVNDPKLWKHYFEYSGDLSSGIRRAFSLSLKLSASQNQKGTSYANKFKPKSPLIKNYTFNLKDMEILFPNHLAGVDKKLLKDYNAIVDMCVENQVTLILFTAPEDEEYSKAQNDIHNIKSIFEASSKSNLNVFYLDYTFGGALWDKKYELWLKDSHHINENDLFSLKLLNDIKMKTDTKVYLAK